MFDEYGADAWYERPIEEFIPAGFACPSCGGTAFERERDILDVWFDSGSSHEAVLPFRPDLTWPADMYLEGSDQHRGWFQSSLLVGLGTRGRPPFREVLTHGFLIDVDGRKMSKSLGNVIQPQAVIKESGAEILRLWVAMSDFREELRVGKQILQRVVEAYRKFRNTLRYLASNLYDFDPATDRVPLERMQEVDRFVLSRYGATAASVVRRLRALRLPGDLPDAEPVPDGGSQRLLRGRVEGPPLHVRGGLAGAPLGADGDVRHGRRPGAPARADPAGHGRRIVAAPARLAEATADRREESVHLAEFPRDVERLIDADLEARWTRLREIRDEVNRALETARQEKLIGTSLAAARGADGRRRDARALLRRYEADLPMLFIVSQVDARHDRARRGSACRSSRADGEKCERCWRVVPEMSRAPGTEGLCDRCVAALPAGDPSTGLGTGGGREVA